MPSVLAIQAEITVSQVERLTRRLGEVARDAYQKVGIGIASLSAVDVEGPIEGGIRMLIHLVDMELPADLQSVRAEDPREPVAQIVRIVDLGTVGDRNAHDESGKRNILHAFKLRRLHKDAWRPGAGHETLRGQTHTESALRLPDDVGIAQIAEMKLVDGVGSDQLVIAQR